MSPDNNDVDDLDFSDLDLDDGSESGFEEEAEESDIPQKGRAAGKKSALFWPVAGVVILAVIGLGLWQFGIIGGGSSREPYVAEGVQPGGTMIPGTEAAALAQQQGASDPFNVMGTPEAAPSESAMAEAMTPGSAAPALDPNASQPMIDDMPVTSVMPAGEAQQPAVEGSTLPMPAQPGDTVPQAAPVETAGPATETPVSTALAEAPTPTVMDAAVEAAAASAASAPVNVTATDLNAIMERLEAIEKRLDAQAAAPEASPAVAGELQDLKEAVARLENREPAAAAEEPAPKAAPKKKTARKAPAKKKPATSQWDKPYDGGAVGAVASVTTTTVSTAAAPTGGYSLRAAQPGIAWVSDSSGALQEVRVGDILPGIGRVNGIAETNGVWTVSGQNGRLTQ